MPKLFGRNVPPVVLGGVGIVGVYLVYTTLFPAPDAPTPAKKAKVAAKKTVGETDYLTSDYVATFAPLSETIGLKDAFKPLVVKLNGGGPNGIPSIDNYTYSGMALLNGVANGLLENGQTGQGDFVKTGQRWHDTWLVVNIDPEEIKLRNDGGDTMTLLAGAAAAKASASAGPAAAGNIPINPMMVGAIGGPDMSVQADTSNQGGPGGRGRGRGRGGRGGGGRGGGGGTDNGGGE